MAKTESKTKTTREQVADFIRNANEDDTHDIARLVDARREEWRARSSVQMAYMDFIEATDPF